MGYGKRVALAIILLGISIALTGMLQEGGHSVFISSQDLCASLLTLGLPSGTVERLPICNGSFGWPVCSSLQLQTMQPHLAELAKHVTIVRDKLGIPHIYGEKDADVAFGLAFAHAEDDFATIQAAILAAHCSSSLTQAPQILFPSLGSAAESDKMCLSFEFEAQVKKGLEGQLSPEGRAVLRGYARGLNYYASLHPSQLLLEDATILFPLSEYNVAVTTLAKMPALMGMDAALSLLYEEDPYYVVSFGSEALQEEETSPAFDSLTPPLPAGSTAFAVSSMKTADKRTTLLVNPHNPWTGHLSLYEAHVHSNDGWHMYGATWPGCPVLQQGVTDTLSWAHGLNFPDLIDVYLLETDAEHPNQYFFDGKWTELRTETVSVKEHLGGPLYRYNKREMLWSHQGPVIKRNHGTYAIRWSGYGRVAQVEQWLRMAKASSLEDWEVAHDMGQLPLFHTVYADVEDNVLYKYNALAPARDERYLWRAFLDGTSSNTLWQEYEDVSQLPRLLNPSSGFVFNANSSPFKVTAEEDMPYAAEDFTFQTGIEEHVTNRGLRLMELLAQDQLTLKDLEAIKWDDRYAIESDVTALLSQVVMRMRIFESESSVVGGNMTLISAVEALEEWDGRVDADNKEAALAVLTASPFIRNGATDPMDYAKKNFVMVIKRFIEVAGGLQQAFGNVRVKWSDVQLLEQHASLGIGGAPDVLASVYAEPHGNGHYRAVAGDSFVMLVSFVDNGEGERRVTAKAVHHHGSSHAINNKHNGDQRRAFAEHQMREVLFYQEDVLRFASSQYHPGDAIFDIM